MVETRKRKGRYNHWTEGVMSSTVNGVVGGNVSNRAAPGIFRLPSEKF